MGDPQGKYWKGLVSRFCALYSVFADIILSIRRYRTKISFPVYFNEPTSMLQRMAEDIEFTETRMIPAVFCRD